MADQETKTNMLAACPPLTDVLERDFNSWWSDQETGLGDAYKFTAWNAWLAATKAENAACVTACKEAADTGNDIGIERDVALWNNAVAYCVRSIKKRSNLSLQGKLRLPASLP